MGTRLWRTPAECAINGGLFNQKPLQTDMKRDALLPRPITQLRWTNVTALGGRGNRFERLALQGVVDHCAESRPVGTVVHWHAP